MATPIRNPRDPELAVRHPVDPGVPDARDPLQSDPADPLQATDPAAGTGPRIAADAAIDPANKAHYGMHPVRGASGWRGILIGVVVFGLLLLLAIFAGVFQFGDTETAAPNAPVGATPEAVNPLGDGEEEVIGGGEEVEPTPGAIDVPGTDTVIDPEQAPAEAAN